MMRPWLQLAITFVVAISLVAAPCRNCQPKPQTETKDCGHDCCPKPNPRQPESCGWQPAAYDAVEAKSDITLDVPAVLPAPPALEQPLTEPVQPSAVLMVQPHSPPAPSVLRL